MKKDYWTYFLQKYQINPHSVMHLICMWCTFLKIVINTKQTAHAFAIPQTRKKEHGKASQNASRARFQEFGTTRFQFNCRPHFTATRATGPDALGNWKTHHNCIRGVNNF